MTSGNQIWMGAGIAVGAGIGAGLDQDIENLIVGFALPASLAYVFAAFVVLPGAEVGHFVVHGNQFNGVPLVSFCAILVKLVINGGQKAIGH